MAQLPNATAVEINEQKVVGYLLSRSHPVGRFKARVFASAGFEVSNAATFVAELRRVAAEGEVVATEDTRFGRKYTVPGELKGPTGRIQVLTGWFQQAGQSHVRLVTVRPR